MPFFRVTKEAATIRETNMNRSPMRIRPRFWINGLPHTRGREPTFLATLELIKESLLEVVQSAPFAPIHVKARTASEEATTEYEEEM